MNKYVWRFSKIFLLAVTLTSCSSSHLLVKKEQMEAADQCLLAQQDRDAYELQQSEQLAETLELMREMMELQKQGDSVLREFSERVRPNLDTNDTLRCEQAPGPEYRVAETAVDKQIVGAQEPVLLTDIDIEIPARVNTGATISALDAQNIQRFERNSEEWVRFSVYNPASEQWLELELKRKLNPDQVNPGSQERRPVVEMRLTLGEVTQLAEIALVDRSGQEFPLVIGRNVLRDLMLVDVGRSNITQPRRDQQVNGLELD